MNFTLTEHSPIIQNFREQLYARFVAPLDGMWEVLYIPSSATYLIQDAGADIGYACIDAEKSLTQVFLQASHQLLMKKAIQELISSKLMISAKLSSIEPVAFNACLFHAKATQPNTINYQFVPQQKQRLQGEKIAGRVWEHKSNTDLFHHD